MSQVVQEPLGAAPSVATGAPPRPARTTPASAAGQGGIQAEGQRPETIECAELAVRNGCHLSTDQVWRLLALRHRYRAGGIREPLPERRVDARLRFARWLYKQGRISG
jgi:hypothetical protein